MRSDDAGDHWTDRITLSQHEGRGLSLAPAISVDGEAVFTAWQDNRNGRYAIFIISKRDFVAPKAFERELTMPIASILVAATIVYFFFEWRSRRLSSGPGET